MRRNNLQGIKVGKLTVINSGSPFFLKSGTKRIKYKCMCDCGNTVEVLSSNLISPTPIKSCGCLKKEINIAKWTKHSACGSRLYTIWVNMKSRCYKKFACGYKNYGGRGVCICDEWKEFTQFSKWAHSYGYKENLTIERKDPNGNYTPHNCTWVAKKEQVHNRRITIKIRINDIDIPLSKLCKKYNKNYNNALRHYHKGIVNDISYFI